MSTLDVTNLKSKLALTPTKFYDKDDKEIGTLCRAWVNFKGTGTVAIRASFNVDSITDIGTGKYTITFANPMPDANYCVQIGNGLNAVHNAVGNTALIVNNSSVTITHLENGIQTDVGFIYVAVFR